MIRVALGVTALLLGGCAPSAFTEDQVLGGATISAAELSEGKKHYVRYCEPCHGEQGDGRGPSSWGLWPSPRNFQKAVFKYAGVADRGLPSDQALVRIIRGGLTGTAMQPWDLPEDHLLATIHYLKTFSPPGKGFRDPERVVSPEIDFKDPFAGDPAEAVQRGKRLYHSHFQCSQCHPRYVSKEELASWHLEGGRTLEAERSVAKPAPSYGNVLLPPDFKVHPLRSVRRDATGAYRVEDLYRVIAYGLSGPMPGYVHLGESDVWSVAHYVRSIAEPPR